MLNPQRVESASDDGALAGEGLAARDITVTYRNGHTALRDASFEIPRGTITALVGVNGAGKSTLFKALMGLLPHASGQVRILGQTVEQALAKNLVAYVPQAEEVDWSFPVLVEDVVMMGRYGHMGFTRHARAEDIAAVDRALERTHLESFADRQIGQLSGGQKKRAFIARGIAQGASIMLLDEPFAGVDPIAVGEIRGLVHDLKSRGIGVLITDHNVRETLGICDRAYIISDGTVF